MRARLLAVSFLLVPVILIGCSRSISSVPKDAVRVRIDGGRYRSAVFDPARLNIRTGQTVAWLNETQTHHNVSPQQFYKSWDDGGSGDLPPNSAYVHTFKRPGYYRYFCSFHPEMVGIVIVRARR